MSMLNSNTIHTADGLVMFQPMLRICSLSVAVSRDRDLVKAKDNLPPEAVLSNGRKHLVEKGTTSTLLAYRKQVDRILRVDGFPFMGGVAVLESAAPARIDALKDLEIKFNEEVDRIAPLLPELYRKQQDKHPLWADILRDGELTESEFRSRCNFAVAVFTLAAPGPNAGQAAQAEFRKIRSQVVPGLLEHIASEAEEVLKVFNPSEASSRIAQPLSRLIGKLHRFSFLDGALAPVAQALMDQLALIPKLAKLDAGSAGIALNLLHALSDPHRLLNDAKLLAPPAVTPPPLFASVPSTPVEVVPVPSCTTEVAVPTPPTVHAPSAFSLGF